jgi:hypothetical protein
MPDSQPGTEEGESGAAVGAAPRQEPRVSPAEPPAEKPGALRTLQRNPILAELVQGEDDLAGLVGYALYKLHKRDWLASFFKTHGRDPTEGEIESYVLGERTQRRLATYRRLAEDVIGRKAAAIITKNAAAVSGPAAALQRVSAVKTASLRSALAPGGAAGAGSQQQRSVTATLIFWIAVLAVLGVIGYYYANNSAFFLGR